MAQFAQARHAILVNGVTRQQVAEVVLEAGTIYEDYARWTDGTGQRWKRIKVRAETGEAYLYDILPNTADD